MSAKNNGKKDNDGRRTRNSSPTKTNTCENSATSPSYTPSKTRKPSNKKVIELKDVKCQTLVTETQDSVCQTEGLEETTMKEESRLLKLENCKIKNKCDEANKELLALKKKYEELNKKLSLMDQQLECTEEIIQSNDKLKKENEVLYERCQNITDEENQRLKNDLWQLKTQLEESLKFADENNSLKAVIDKLEGDLEIAQLTVRTLKDSLTKVEELEKENCNDKPQEDNNQLQVLEDANGQYRQNRPRVNRWRSRNTHRDNVQPYWNHRQNNNNGTWDDTATNGTDQKGNVDGSRYYYNSDYCKSSFDSYE